MGVQKIHLISLCTCYCGPRGLNENHTIVQLSLDNTFYTITKIVILQPISSRCVEFVLIIG